MPPLAEKFKITTYMYKAWIQNFVQGRIKQSNKSKILHNHDQMAKNSEFLNDLKHCSKEWFDLALWTCDLKIDMDHLLVEGNPCTKFGIEQVKGSKDIEWTTQWAEKSDLTLTFEHVTWKSVGIIYSLRATPVPSLILIKWRGQKILSGQHLVYRPTVRPTDSCKTICPLFKGGHKNDTAKLTSRPWLQKI